MRGYSSSFFLTVAMKSRFPFYKKEQPCDQRDLMKCNTNILILIFLQGEVEIMSFCTSQSIQFLLPSLKMCFRNTCLSCAIWA